MKDKLTIRNAKKSDELLLKQGTNNISFLEHSPKDDLSDLKLILQPKNRKTIRILEKNGIPIGFIFYLLKFNLMFIGKIFWIQEVFIVKKERTKGYGSLLYDDVLKIAKNKGYKNIYCDVYDVNTGSVKYHKKHKFKPIYMIYKRKI